MFLMYVDESGDPGLVGSPCRYYVLSGLVLHELSWRVVLERLLAFRCRMRDVYGLKLREELHAARMINKPGDLVRIKRHDRLEIIRDFRGSKRPIYWHSCCTRNSRPTRTCARKAGTNYFGRRSPILCTSAWRRDPRGIRAAVATGPREEWRWAKKIRGRITPPPGGTYCPVWPRFRSTSRKSSSPVDDNSPLAQRPAPG